MPRRSTPVATFLRLPWRDRGLLAEATGWLLVARLALLLVPFRRLAPWLGRAMSESPKVSRRGDELSARVGWAVRTASRRTPWQTKCFAEAIAGKAMLKRRRVDSTLYLGLRKDDVGELQAHAWLRCGGRVITGGRTSGGFTVVATFAEELPRTGGSAPSTRHRHGTHGTDRGRPDRADLSRP